MNRTEIVEKLTSVFHDVFGDNSIVLNDEMTSADVEKWDSLTHMLMISTVEEQFGIRFKLKELNKLKKVGDMIEILQEKLS